jgi:hypothetical protein
LIDDSFAITIIRKRSCWGGELLGAGCWLPEALQESCNKGNNMLFFHDLKVIKDFRSNFFLLHLPVEYATFNLP